MDRKLIATNQVRSIHYIRPLMLKPLHIFEIEITFSFPNRRSFASSSNLPRGRQSGPHLRKLEIFSFHFYFITWVLCGLQTLQSLNLVVYQRLQSHLCCLLSPPCSKTQSCNIETRTIRKVTSSFTK